MKKDNPPTSSETASAARAKLPSPVDAKFKGLDLWVKVDPKATGLTLTGVDAGGKTIWPPQRLTCHTSGPEATSASIAAMMRDEKIRLVAGDYWFTVMAVNGKETESSESVKVKLHLTDALITELNEFEELKKADLVKIAHAAAVTPENPSASTTAAKPGQHAGTTTSAVTEKKEVTGKDKVALPPAPVIPSAAEQPAEESSQAKFDKALKDMQTHLTSLETPLGKKVVEADGRIADVGLAVIGAKDIVVKELKDAEGRILDKIEKTKPERVSSDSTQAASTPSREVVHEKVPWWQGARGLIGLGLFLAFVFGLVALVGFMIYKSPATTPPPVQPAFAAEPLAAKQPPSVVQPSDRSKDRDNDENWWPKKKDKKEHNDEPVQPKKEKLIMKSSDDTEPQGVEVIVADCEPAQGYVQGATVQGAVYRDMTPYVPDYCDNSYQGCPQSSVDCGIGFTAVAQASFQIGGGGRGGRTYAQAGRSYCPPPCPRPAPCYSVPSCAPRGGYSRGNVQSRFAPPTCTPGYQFPAWSQGFAWTRRK